MINLSSFTINYRLFTDEDGYIIGNAGHQRAATQPLQPGDLMRVEASA